MRARQRGRGEHSLRRQQFYVRRPVPGEALRSRYRQGFERRWIRRCPCAVQGIYASGGARLRGQSRDGGRHGPGFPLHPPALVDRSQVGPCSPEQLQHARRGSTRRSDDVDQVRGVAGGGVSSSQSCRANLAECDLVTRRPDLSEDRPLVRKTDLGDGKRYSRRLRSRCGEFRAVEGSHSGRPGVDARNGGRDCGSESLRWTYLRQDRPVDLRPVSRERSRLLS
jgi:hypothetical protein